MELFITDLDGTLLDRNAELSEESAEILNRLIGGGMNFTAATARTIASAGKILSGLDLRLPLILMNGVLIYDPVKREYEVVNRLPREVSEHILKRRRELNIAPFMYTMRDGEMHTYFDRLVNEAMHEFYEERTRKYYKSFTQASRLEKVQDDIIYLCFIDSRERLLPLYDELSADSTVGLTFYKDIYSDGMWYLEVFSSAASKEAGVKYLREKYGFDRITAFGDNLNDLPMFAAADVKIAVKNAARELISGCDRVIGANTENGVAKYLEEIFNG